MSQSGRKIIVTTATVNMWENHSEQPHDDRIRIHVGEANIRTVAPVQVHCVLNGIDRARKLSKYAITSVLIDVSTVLRDLGVKEFSTQGIHLRIIRP